MSSKLSHVRKALQDNPNITIVGSPEQNHLLSGMCWNHTVDFYVAPKTGGVYTTKELQALMMSLVPGLEPTQKDNFSDGDSDMVFGKLYFDENIGTEAVHREIVLSDKDMFLSKGFVNGKRIIESVNNIQRRIWVRLFPNANIAAAALEGENEFRISKSELSKYQRVLARLVNLLS